MMPGDDGLALCRELRAQSRVPILMLTARGDELDRIIGLEMGADDYLPKPFHPRELLARIRSILRRVQELAGVGPAREYRFAGWILDLGARHLVGADGVAVPLSSGEFRLLQALVEHANRVMSRDRLMDVLSGREAGPFDRSVDVMIGRLRRRLGDDGREPEIIKTVRNEGYLFAAKVERKG
jgi:two-component system OmpR family response regulator